MHFAGAATGSVITNSDGTFTAQLQASGMGAISVSTSDSWGLVSSPFSVTVAPPLPQIINVQATEESNNSWTFTGTVVAPSTANLVVTFSGLQSVQGTQISIAADGAFSLSVTLQPGEEGTLDAETTDCWGQSSNVVSYSVRQ